MMHHLMPLAALLLSINPTETKVVTSVEDCEEFFLDQTPPKITGILEGGKILDQNRYKLICQTFENTTTFVTLYDTHNKIPVFSAAKFRGSAAGRPSHPWMIEPQLEDPTDVDNMRQADKNINYKHQAGDTDYDPYNQQGFDRGHLFPNSYGSNPTEKSSTFTLTNAVPQNKRFSRGKWKKMELCVKTFLDENCINNNNRKEGFVVIGAKPSDSSLLNNNKINIPSVLWSAFCCYSRSQNKWLAGAHWGNNRDDDLNYLETKTLGALYTTLGIEAFPGTRCPKDLTTQVYSKCALKSKKRKVIVSHKVPRKCVGKKKYCGAKKRNSKHCVRMKG
ncbi:hypothetical protein ACER0C_001276 [Sarotherodon galilaeus]